MGVKVLSLFDGMSCGQLALSKANIKVDEYYAAEINKTAIKVTQYNYPNTVQLGDVTKLSFKNGILYSENGSYNVGYFDYVIGGSPCQSISNLGKKEGLSRKSGLFYHWLRIRDEVNPAYWLLENVVGNKDSIQEITNTVGGFCNCINSNLVSAQNRKRLYWTNFNTPQPANKNINLVNILDTTPAKESQLTEGRLRWLLSEKGRECINKRYASLDPVKANCLTARSDASWNCNYITRDNQYFKLSCNEYEKLQTVPVNYTNVLGVSVSKRYEMLGNGWTVDVIAHIFKCLKGD